MTNKILATPEQLRELLTYDPETGRLYWRERPIELFAESEKRSKEATRKAWNNQFKDKEAFTTTMRSGYKQGAVFNRLLFAHRVAWAIHHGKWPEDQIDHINGCRSDNRIINLRGASNAENSRNQRLKSSNTSGFKGVSYISARSKWQAQIVVDGNKIHLGLFTSAESAHDAYATASAKHHKNFSRLD